MIYGVVGAAGCQIVSVINRDLYIFGKTLIYNCLLNFAPAGSKAFAIKGQYFFS